MLIPVELLQDVAYCGIAEEQSGLLHGLLVWERRTATRPLLRI